MSRLKVIWANKSKEQLKAVYEYYKVGSLQGAINVKNDILKSPKTIHYSKQYQVDDINA